jgi:hypothetical protein
MKKIVASVGLAALGASTLPSASAQSLAAPDASKPWSIAATLRGFYDDNTATLPNDVAPPPGQHRGSFGFEVSPSANLVWSPQEQTTLSAGVLYSMMYYDNTPPNSADHIDQSLTANLSLTHAFNEELKGSASDSFVWGQEPDLLRAGNAFATFQRISGDNYRNYASLALDAQVAPKVGINLGYDNTWYHYQASGATADPFTGIIIASPAGVLNRVENRGHVEALYELLPETKALVGYQFTDVNFTGDEYIGGYATFFGLLYPVVSNQRNYREHTAYVGLEQTFTPQLTGSVRAGASYTDYYNDPNTSSSWAPYALASLRYAYSHASYVEVGFSYDREATDVVGLFGNAGFTTSAESAVVYGTVNHQLAPNLYGSLMAQFQNNIYQGGIYNNDTDQFFLVGLDLEYRFNPNFSAHVGYDYDRLDSQIAFRAFDRNRVYIGVTASY